MMITGAAPVSPPNLTYIRAALGCHVSHIHAQIFYETKRLFNYAHIHSYTKDTARLNVQPDAPCLYLATGLQVNGNKREHPFVNLNFPQSFNSSEL